MDFDWSKYLHVLHRAVLGGGKAIVKQEPTVQYAQVGSKTQKAFYSFYMNDHGSIQRLK